LLVEIEKNREEEKEKGFKRMEGEGRKKSGG